MSFSDTKTNSGNLFFSFLKGIIFAIIISFALIILLAFSLKWFSLSDSVIFPINMAIKALSVAVGSLIAVRGERGLVKGSIFGILYIGLAFIIFSVLAGSFSFDFGVVLDLVCAALVGGIVGIIKVNRKQSV